MGVSHDIAPPERQDRAGDRLRQRGGDDAGDEKTSCRRPGAIRRRCNEGGTHEPLPPSTATRAERPGTRRPGKGFPTRRIFTGTRCTTRTKFPVALSAVAMSWMTGDVLPVMPLR